MLQEIPFEKNPKFKNLTDDRLIEIIDGAKAEIADHEIAIKKIKEEGREYYEELHNRAGLEQDNPKLGLCLRYMITRGWRTSL